MALIKMKASRLHDDRNAFECPREELAFMPCHTWLGKTRNRAIRNANPVGDFVRERPHARPQNDRDS
jgi:hypothetical protein